MKNKRGLIITLVFLLLGLTATLLYVYRDKIFGKGDNTNGNTANGCGNAFPLQVGSNGPEVVKLQQYLLTKSANCLPNYGADGDFGSETQACAQSILGTTVVDCNKYKAIGLA